MSILKRVPCTLFLFLLSCQGSNPRLLEESHSHKSPLYSSKRTQIITDKLYGGIDVEILSTESERKVYLIIHSIPLAKTEDQPPMVPILLTINGEEKEISGFRFEGGQKVLLKQEDGNEVANALFCGNKVTFLMGRYSEEIELSTCSKM